MFSDPIRRSSSFRFFEDPVVRFPDITFEQALQSTTIAILVSQIASLVFKKNTISFAALTLFFSFEIGVLVKKGISSYTQADNIDRQLLRWKTFSPYLLSTLVIISLFFAIIFPKYGKPTLGIIAGLCGYIFVLEHDI